MISNHCENPDNECPFTFDELLDARVIQRWGYEQEHVCTLWEVHAAQPARGLLNKRRLAWANRMGSPFGDNKETYQLEIKGEIYYITFWDGFIHLGTQLRAKRSTRT